MLATTSSRPGRRPDPAIRTLWQQRLLRFQRSGLSVSAFCDREGISTPSFYVWRRRLRNAAPAATDAPRFLPVRVLAAAAPVELVLPGGAVLRLTSDCDLAFVRSLVASLGGAPC
jgi:transposase